MGFGLWALASFCVIWALLDFKRDFPKILDSIDMVRVVNEIKSCSVKILSSPVVS